MSTSLGLHLVSEGGSYLVSTEKIERIRDRDREKKMVELDFLVLYLGSNMDTQCHA
jgi:hypothetical protein